MNTDSRAAVCGAIATYNATEPVFRMYYLHAFDKCILKTKVSLSLLANECS